LLNKLIKPDHLSFILETPVWYHITAHPIDPQKAKARRFVSAIKAFPIRFCNRIQTAHFNTFGIKV